MTFSQLNSFASSFALIPIFNFIVGCSLMSDTYFYVGYSCLMLFPEQIILYVIKFDKKAHVIVIRGINAGQTGTVEEIKEGSFILPKRVLVTLGERTIEIPTDLVMVVGKEKPVIQVR